MIRTIFFDFDGVIVESVDIKTRAFAKLFEHEGEGIVKKVIFYHLENAGVSRYEKFRYIYKEILKRFLSDEEFEMLCKKFAASVMDVVIKAPYVEGAKEFLENYSQAYKCFVVSATPQEEIEGIIQKRHIWHFFKAVYGAPAKKNDVVKTILVKENIDPCNAVYVGDAMSDYLAAKENNVAFIARVTNDNNSLFRDLGCIKLNSLAALEDIINSIGCQMEKNLG
jgi:HAD superfamily hydrolase (TIGR01549 family)